MNRDVFITVIAGAAPDVTAPTVTIASTETSPTFASPVPLTITFSEAVTGFTIDDITVAGCTLADFATADNIVYTVDATPTDNTLTVDIDAGVCTDAAGNENEAATQFVILSMTANLLARQDGATGFRPNSDFTGALCTEGQSVGSWEDARGGGVGFIQATGGNQPTWTANTGGSGAPGMVDDGTNWLYKTITIPDQMTVFVAYNGRSGVNGCLFGNADSGDTPLQRNTHVWWSVAGSQEADFSGGATLNTSNILTLTFDYAGGTSIARLDGTQRASYTGAMAKPTGAVFLGSGFSEPLTGNIVYALIYTGILTADEMTAIENYLEST